MNKMSRFCCALLLGTPLSSAAVPLLISAQELAEAPEQYRILDTRGRLAYLSGHIPGAQRVEWKQLSHIQGKPGDAGWASLANTTSMQQALRTLGLHKTSRVVVYAAPPAGWGEDGRIAWTLRAAGIEQVQILDGGIDAWKRQDYPLNRLPESAAVSDLELMALNLEGSIDTATLRAHLGQLALIDTRSASEFAGATHHGEARGGHLPGAINIPFTELLETDGTAKSPDAIRALLADHGLLPDTPIVTYCTAGIRSAHTQQLLAHAGFSRVRNYSGFYHWAATPALPLEVTAP